jgi:CRP/FNR family transcriptional regulator, cyclic AMP receptor protein
MLNSDLLKGLPAAEAERVLALSKRLVLTSGAELFRLGEPADSVYLVARGRIRLTLPMQIRNREEDVLVEERSSGQMVGWSGLIAPHCFTLTASAALETEVFELRREALHAYLAEHPETGYAISVNLASVVGQRLQLFQAMWVREVQRMVEARCA